MDLIKKLRASSDKGFDLKDQSADATPGAKSREWAEEQTKHNVDQLRELQYKLFVENKRSLLIVLQAPDAAGKDGLIRKVLGKLNPQGCVTHGFKKPSEQELAHDFLWRVHQKVPAKGQVAIFNRSHYEDVLVVRVHDLVPEKIWKRRYEQINAFEQLLNDAGTTVLKFYLNISPEEQLERFAERLEDPTRQWKLNPFDYTERKHWRDYQVAYGDVFQRCNSNDAPWFVIPANKKWYRDYAVSEIVVKTLQRMDPQLPPVQVDLEEIRRLYEEAKLAATND